MRLGKTLRNLLLSKEPASEPGQSAELEHLLETLEMFVLSKGIGVRSMQNVELSKAIEEFLLAKKAEGTSKRTLVKYKQQIESFATRAKRDHLADITAHDIRLFLSELKSRDMQPSSVNTYYRSIHAFLCWTVREYGFPFPNPVEWIDAPKVPHRLPPSLSDDGFLGLLVACDEGQNPERDRAILMLLLDTGVRAGELVTLKVADLDLPGKELKCFGKDQEDRVVPLEEGAARAVEAYLDTRTRCKSEDPLFPSSLGPDCFLTQSGLLSLLKRLAARASLDENVYVHLLRHTFAKKWLKGPGKGDIQALSDIMGHSSVSTTQIYAAYDSEDLKEMHQHRSPGNQILEKQRRQLTLW